jgi:hypothetical protein
VPARAISGAAYRRPDRRKGDRPDQGPAELLDERFLEVFQGSSGFGAERDDLATLGRHDAVSIRKLLAAGGAAPEVIYVFEKTGRIVTEQNKQSLTKAELREWEAAIGEFRRTAIRV